MRLSLLFTDQTAVRACREAGRTAEAWNRADSCDREAVLATMLRSLARDAAAAEGISTTGDGLLRASAGIGGMTGERLAVRFLQAYRSLAESGAPLSAEALCAAYAVLDADSTHVAPEREQSLVNTAAEALTSALENTGLDDLSDTIAVTQALLAGRRERRLHTLAFPFFMMRLIDLPLPVPARHLVSEDTSFPEELERIALLVRSQLDAVGGLRTQYAAKLTHERTTSKSMKVAALSIVFPVLTQATVERELGLSGRGALNVLQRLTEPSIGILLGESGNAVTRRIFRNPGAAQLLP